MMLKKNNPVQKNHVKVELCITNLAKQAYGVFLGCSLMPQEEGE